MKTDWPLIVVSGGVVQNVLGVDGYVLVDWDNIPAESDDEVRALLTEVRKLSYDVGEVIADLEGELEKREVDLS